MKTHFEKIIQRRDLTITTTLCNRMTSKDEINSTGNENEVTCKFCLNLMRHRRAA